MENLEIKKANSSDYEKFAQWCGVRVESVEKMGMLVCKFGWLFPMYNQDRERTGYRVRWFKLGKGVLPGGHLGLFIPHGTNPAAVEVITEGESDLLAALDLGLVAIARPGAGVLVRETIEYLKPQRFNGITIMADRDESGIGLGEAEKLGEKLFIEQHLIRVILPPEPHKDLRDWYRSENITRSDFWKHADKYPWQATKNNPPGFFRVGNWQLRKGMIGEIGLDGYAVFNIIGSYRGSDGRCRVSRQNIAELMGKSVSAVDRGLKKLRKAGLIEIVLRGNKGRANIYRIHLGPFRFTRNENFVYTF